MGCTTTATSVPLDPVVTFAVTAVRGSFCGSSMCPASERAVTSLRSQLHRTDELLQSPLYPQAQPNEGRLPAQ